MYTGPGVDPVRHSTTINRDSHSWPKLIFFLPDPTDSVSSSLWSRTEHFVFSVIIFVTCCCSCQFSSFFPVPLCSRIKFSCFLSLSAAAGDNYVVTLGEKSLSRCVIHKGNLLSQMWNGPVVGTGHCGESVEMKCYCRSLPFHNTTFALILSWIYSHFVHLPCHFSV